MCDKRHYRDRRAQRGLVIHVNPDRTQTRLGGLRLPSPPGALLRASRSATSPREHATTDAIENYLIPWYAFARDHGVGGLGEAFTNYTPFYSYLLLIAARFDWLGQPLSLVKAISAVFEFGCAIVAAQIVWRATNAPWRTTAAFCRAFG